MTRVMASFPRVYVHLDYLWSLGFVLIIQPPNLRTGYFLSTHRLDMAILRQISVHHRLLSDVMRHLSPPPNLVTTLVTSVLCFSSVQYSTHARVGTVATALARAERTEARAETAVGAVLSIATGSRLLAVPCKGLLYSDGRLSTEKL